MEVGFGFDGSGIPLRSAVRLAQAAERLGLGSVWSAEDHFTGRDAVAPLAAIAAVTSRVALGTAILPIHHLRHPVLLAATAASLDELSGGRLILGLGLADGWPSYPEGARPLRLMREAVATVRALLAGDRVEYGGRSFALTGTFAWEVFPPLRSRVPVYLGARGPQMTKLAGKIGDGLILELWMSPHEVADRVGWFHDGAREEGREEAPLPVACNIHIYASADGTLDAGLRHFVAGQVARALRGGVPLPDVEPAEARIVADAVARGEADGAAERVTPAMAEVFCAAGTPTDCLRVLRRYEKAGVDVAILFPFGGDPDLALEIGAAFATETS